MAEIIRSILEADLAAVLKIENAAHSHPWPLVQFSKRLNCGRHVHNLLEIDGELAAYYMASEVAGEAELLNISVSPTMQGKGLGEKLLQHLLTVLKPDSREVYLEVRASNVAAIALYEKVGFHQLGTRPNYYPCSKRGREDALLYAYSVI